MPDPVLFRPQDDVTRVMPRALVYTKTRWTDAWTLQPDLIAMNCNFTLSAVGQATFRYHFGSIIPRGETRPREIPPLEIRDHWIKIICIPNDATTEAEWIKWYGIVTADSRDHHGPARGKASGDQIITALSPEYLLTRVQVTHSRLRGSGEYFIERALTFNGWKTDRSGTRFSRGNKRSGHLAFADDLADAEDWNSKDITDYLLQFILKQSHGDVYPRPLRDVNITLNVANDIIYTPLEVQADGRSVFDIIQQIWTRQRGLSWRLEFLGTQAMELGFALSVYSLADQDVDLADGQSLPANQYRVIIDTSKAHGITRNATQIDQTRRYKQVIAEGGYFGSVFTVRDSLTTSALVKAWSNQDESKYQEAAKNTPGYAALDLSEKRSLNDQFRMSESMRHVYTQFKVRDDWDGMITYEGLTRPVFPEFVQEPGPLESAQIKADPSASLASQSLWLSGMRFLPYLPLYESVDYNTNVLEPDDPLASFLRPFATCYIEDPGKSPSSNGYYMMDSIEIANSLDETKGSDTTLTLSCSLRMDDQRLGLAILPNGVGHKIDNPIFPWQGDDIRAESHVKKSIVKRTDMEFTVYAHSDKRVRYVYPPLPYETEDEEGEPVEVDRTSDIHSTLLIRLGDRARMDYIAPFTVLDVNKKREQVVLGGDIPSTGKLIRDDRPYLATVAKMAYAWYSTERRSLSLGMRQLWGTIKIGMLVVRLQHGKLTLMTSSEGGGIRFAWSNGSKWLAQDVSNLLVNSVVSNISYNFEQGTTDITTAFAELQFE